MLTDIMQYANSPDGIDTIGIAITVLVYALLILVCLPFHEFAHAYMAFRLGDNTARYKGRLSLSPFAHLDLIGTIMMLTVGVGFAKPVPVNSLNFKNRKLGMAITSLAGPLSNLLLALIGMIALKSAVLLGANFYVCTFFSIFVSVNIGLTVFNLLPVPPLDGSRILLLFLKEEQYFKLMRYEQYIMIGLLVLMMTGILSIPLEFLSNCCWWLLDRMTFFLG